MQILPVLKPGVTVPVDQHQVIPEQGTLCFGPHDAHQAACVQVFILVEGVSQVVHRLTKHKHGESAIKIPYREETLSRSLFAFSLNQHLFLHPPLIQTEASRYSQWR